MTPIGIAAVAVIGLNGLIVLFLILRGVFKTEDDNNDQGGL